MRHLILILAAVCAVTFWASPASADPITFIHTGSGSGSLDGVLFDVSEFTITATGDTSNRTSGMFPGIFIIPHDAASIDIVGLGTLTFTEDTETFVNNGNEVVGFGRFFDLFDGPVDPAFATWDMLSSIGPISGSGALMQWAPGVQTNLGLLVFDDDTDDDFTKWDIPTTFQAIVSPVPVPGAVVLGALGLGVAGQLCRRRKA